MKSFLFLTVLLLLSCLASAGTNGVDTKSGYFSDNLVIRDSLDTDNGEKFMGEKFIRYMYKPDKRPRNKDEWGEKKFYVLEVSTDVMEGGVRRAMPFTMIVRDGVEYFVAFEVVTSFDTKEEALKYAEENGITDIDITDYEEVTPESNESDN